MITTKKKNAGHFDAGLERTGGREAAADHVAHLVDDLGATPG